MPAGYIDRRQIKQLYDEQEGMFLPDRFIRGTCPKCGAEDQYGDSCESCGSTYAPTDLIDPRSAVTGSPPVMKESEHYFFRLSEFEERLQAMDGLGGPAAGNRQQTAGVVHRRSARLGHIA